METKTLRVIFTCEAGGMDRRVRKGLIESWALSVSSFLSKAVTVKSRSIVIGKSKSCIAAVPAYRHLI